MDITVPLKDHLTRLAQPATNKLLLEVSRGIEKESLRVAPDGCLSQREHPTALGSALTHPSITTDFSEALLEFITAPSRSIATVIDELDDIQSFTYSQLNNELLWVSSMPCKLGDDEQIPIAHFGRSNIGQMKSIYRTGLGHRYGRSMQTIAGIHYNFSISDALWEHLRASTQSPLSLQDYKTSGYFGLIRNFRRLSWLLHYLLGATPAVCRSFVQYKPHHLAQLAGDPESLYAPYATSLRMGGLGYQSDAQSALAIDYNDMHSYVTNLRSALDMPYAAYQAIGLRDPQQNYRQLNTHLLQIENEFYSAIRPKRTTESGEPPLHALQDRGIEYVEVRCLDLNPFAAHGIDLPSIRFLDSFLLFCLLSESATSSDAEQQDIDHNQTASVNRGREPGLLLQRDNDTLPLVEWGRETLAEIAPVAALLDRAHGGYDYTQAMNAMNERLEDPNKTPSAMILEAMNTRQESYHAFAMRMARQHADHYSERRPSAVTLDRYRQMAEQSLQQQRLIEHGDQLTFERYLADYYRQ